MIAARGGRTDITNILLEGEHMDLDIQKNVRIMYTHYIFMSMYYCESESVHVATWRVYTPIIKLTNEEPTFAI